MYFAPHEVAQTREQFLNNLIATSTACIEAGERLTGLFMRSGRALVESGSEQAQKLLQGGDPLKVPAEVLGGDLKLAPARMFEELFDIFGDTHAALLRVAESQLRACDRLLAGALDRAARSSPWEGEVALRVMKTHLQTAENAVHSLTTASIQTVELAENQVREVAASLEEAAAPAPAPARPARRRKAT